MEESIRCGFVKVKSPDVASRSRVPSSAVQARADAMKKENQGSTSAGRSDAREMWRRRTLTASTNLTRPNRAHPPDCGGIVAQLSRKQGDTESKGRPLDGTQDSAPQFKG